MINLLAPKSIAMELSEGRVKPVCADKEKKKVSARFFFFFLFFYKRLNQEFFYGGHGLELIEIDRQMPSILMSFLSALTCPNAIAV